MLASGGADGEGIGHRGGEGLLDHRVDAAFGGGFDDFAVILNVGVDEDGVGVELVEHLVHVGVEELVVEVEFGFVMGGERDVRLADAN